jgi:hypothetical protein
LLSFTILNGMQNQAPTLGYRRPLVAAKHAPKDSHD